MQEEFSEAFDSRFIKYAFMSLEERAIPDARDGLKPSQRRVLVTMNDLKLMPNSATEKSAKICGLCSGNYHPHGEAVVYPTMYRLVQPWIMRYPLAIGQGNFGNVDGDPPAAMRYSEARLSKYGAALLTDLSPNVVSYQNNYNEKLQEPTILPAVLPNLLVNGCEGIAVGWATKMLPHNLNEVVSVIKAYIKNPKITPEEILELMPGPDFPTGAKIIGQSGVLDYYKTGKGSVKVEGIYKIEEQKNGKTTITITELPYQASPAQLCLDIQKFVENNKFDHIHDLKNLSSKKTGMNVVVELTKGANPTLVVNNLLKHTCLRKHININATVLIGGKVIPEAPLVKLIETFISHRKIVLTNKFKTELATAEQRIHILEGLLGIVDKIDAVIKLIRDSDSPEDAEEKLISKKFVKTIEQAKAVLTITLRQLTKLESNKLELELENLQQRHKWLTKVLNNESEVKKLIIQEQEDLVNKIGDRRRTLIASETKEILDEDLIKDENFIITLTGEGYIRSTSIDAYRIQDRGGKGSLAQSNVTENIVELFELNSKDYLLIFTNKGLVYQKRAFEIPQGNKTGKGTHVSNILNLTENEYVTNIVATKNSNGNLIIVTKKGFIKKTPITEYESSRKNSGIRGVKLTENDQVAFVFLSHGNKDIFIVTANGRCVRYNEKLIPTSHRDTKGSIALKLDNDDEIVQVMSLNTKEMPDILTVTTGGFGKKTSIEEYPKSASRAVKGYSVMSKKGIDKNGKLSGAVSVTKDDSILLMTTNGKCIRLNSTDIKNTHRTTIGVKLVNLDSTDSVVKIAKLS